MSALRDEPIDDFCFCCDQPIVKDQKYTWDGVVLRHAFCCNEDNRSND